MTVCNGRLSLHRDKRGSNNGRRRNQSTERTAKTHGNSTALPTPESTSGDTAGAGKRKVQVVGARRIWGTMKDSTVKSVKNVISRVCKIDGGLRVKRKTKENPVTNRTKWWFVIHADECLLSDLDAKWEQVKLQTLWKLEPCFKPENPPTEAETPPTEAEIPPTDARTSETDTDSVPPPTDLETAHDQNVSLATTSSDTADSQQQLVPGSD